MNNGVLERAEREWWVVRDGIVLQSKGLSCAPEHPDVWWFPMLGYSMSEGYHVFPTKEAAKAKARELLLKERDVIDRKLANL